MKIERYIQFFNLGIFLFIHLPSTRHRLRGYFKLSPEIIMCQNRLCSGHVVSPAAFKSEEIAR